MSHMSVMEAGECRVVAIEYPIQAITPSRAPTIISMESCMTMGLHSESISRYAYRKKPPMHSVKMITPAVLRPSMPGGAISNI